MIRKLFLARFAREADAATSGSAAVEFALMMPVLLALVVGALNYGIMGLQMSTLISAARGGAEYAKSNPTDASLTTNTTTVTNVSNTTAGLFCRCSDGTAATQGRCALGKGDLNPCASGARPIFAAQVGTTTQNALFSIGSFSFSSLSAQTTMRFD